MKRPRRGKNPNMLCRGTNNNKILRCGQRNVSFLGSERTHFLKMERKGTYGRLTCKLKNKMSSTTPSLNKVLPQFYPSFTQNTSKALFLHKDWRLKQIEESSAQLWKFRYKQEEKQELVLMWLRGATWKHSKSVQYKWSRYIWSTCLQCSLTRKCFYSILALTKHIWKVCKR